MNRCLGRTPKRNDPRTLRFANYTRGISRAAPDKRLWQLPISDWGVMGNNQYGNCVIVTAAHAILTWRANELGDTRRITDAAVIELSRSMGALAGYNILDRLNYWRRVGMWADNLWAFMSVDLTNQDEVRNAVNVFGCLDIGVNLPNAWRNSDIWNTGNGRSYSPGSWGGHSVPIVGYDPEYLWAASWGECLPMEWAALPEYCDEGYALINSNWLAGDSVTPSGFDLPALHADLQRLAP